MLVIHHIKMQCYALFLCCTCLLGLGFSISVSEQVRVIAALKKHFRSGCVFLLNGGERDFQYEVNLLRELSAAQITVASVLEADHTQCHRNQVLFVMTTNYDAAFQQVTKSSISKDTIEELCLVKMFLSSSDVSASVWLLFLDSNIDVDKMFDLNIPFDCEFLVVQKRKDYIQLTEVYRTSPSLALKTEYFGSWSPTSGLIAPVESLFLRRSDLQGITFRVGVMDDVYIAVIKEKDGKPVKLRGFSYEAWKVLEEKLNFSTVYIKPQDGQYGMEEDDGTWNGLVGMVLRNETDVSITPLIWNKQRDGVVDFIATMFKITLALAVKEPDSSELIWNKFLLPLSFGLWMSVLATIIGSALLLFVIEKTWNRCLNRQSWDKTISSLSEAFFLTLSVFCYQGHHSTPSCSSGRVVLVSAYLTSVIVLCCYSGSLISYITTQEYKLPFNDLEGFLKDGTYKMGVLRSSGDFTYFKESNNSMIKKIYSDFIAPHMSSSLFSSYIEGLERVCLEQKYAIVFGEDKFTPLNNLKCNIHYLPIVEYDMSMTMRKKSPYKKVLSYRIHQMYQSGIIKILLHLNTPMQNVKTKSDFDPVSLTQTTPICMVLILGVSVATMIVLIEQVLHYYSPSTKYPVRKLANNKCLKDVINEKFI